MIVVAVGGCEMPTRICTMQPSNPEGAKVSAPFDIPCPSDVDLTREPKSKP